MAAAAGVSESTVQVVWHARAFKPHRVQTFKLSNDPRFEHFTPTSSPWLNLVDAGSAT